MYMKGPYKDSKTNVCVFACAMKNRHVQIGYLLLFVQLINDLSLCIAKLHFSPHTLPCFAMFWCVCGSVCVSVSKNVYRG